MTTTILAGNPARLTATFAAPNGEAFGAVTAVACVTPPTGIADDIAIASEDITVTPNDDNTAVTVVAEWQIPDAQTAGSYRFTLDLSGGLIGAYEQPFDVRARVQPEVGS